MKLSLLVCMMTLFCLSACHRDPQNPDTLVRLDYAPPFEPGTAFAIARQSYPDCTHQRISTIDRVKIDKQIQSALKKHAFTYDLNANLLISYYREYLALEDAAPDHVQVDVLAPHTRLHYQYETSGIDPRLCNARDGALVIDIVDIKKGSLLRQLVVPYYFGALQEAMRASRDREDIEYVPPINLIGSQIGL